MEFAHLCSRHEAAFFFALALLRNVESALKELSAMEQQSFAEKLGVKRCQWVLRRLWSDLREAGSAMVSSQMSRSWSHGVVAISPLQGIPYLIFILFYFLPFF